MAPHLSLELPHLKSSTATCGLWLLSWAAALDSPQTSGRQGQRLGSVQKEGSEQSHHVTSDKAGCLQEVYHCGHPHTHTHNPLRLPPYPALSLGWGQRQEKKSKELDEDLAMDEQLSGTIWLPLVRSAC